MKIEFLRFAVVIAIGPAPLGLHQLGLAATSGSTETIRSRRYT